MTRYREFSTKSQCEGKRPFSNKFEAKKAAKWAEQVAGRLHAYRCGHCGQFHIGHKPAVKQAQRPDYGRGSVVNP